MAEEIREQKNRVEVESQQLTHLLTCPITAYVCIKSQTVLTFTKDGLKPKNTVWHLLQLLFSLTPLKW